MTRRERHRPTDPTTAAAHYSARAARWAWIATGFALIAITLPTSGACR